MTPSSLESIVPFRTVTLAGDHGTSLRTYNLHITNISSALYRWTEVPVASSASSLTRSTNTTETVWDCTAICGKLNENGECSDISACVKMDGDKVKSGKPPWASSAGSARLNGHGGGIAVAVVTLIVGLWMLL